MQQQNSQAKASVLPSLVSIIALAGVIGLTVFTLVRINTIPRIGVVDNTVLLSNFSDAISARQQLDVEKKRWQDNIHALEDSAKAAFEVMRLNYNKAPQASRQEMEKRLDRWNTELSRYTRAVDDMSKKKETELLQPVIDRLNSYVRIWATKHGYQIVVGTGSGGVILSAVDQVNITGKVLDDLNKLYGKTQTPVADIGKPVTTDTIRQQLPVPAPASTPANKGKDK